MKKILALILASLMLLSFAACGTNNEENTTEVNNEEITTDNGSNEETTAGNNEENNEEVNEGIIAPSVADDTWGYAFWNVFADSVASNPEIATGEIVYNILMSEAGQALGFCENTDMVEGFLPGFDADITGFKSATVFTPAAAGFAFMGYVFELEENADVNAFMQILEENHNTRWMICMTAEMVTMGAYNNYVLFVMSPAYMSGAGAQDAVVVYPENAEDGTYAAEIWNFFEAEFGFNPAATAEGVAYAIAYSPVVPYNVADVNAVDTTAANEHFANGFDCVESIYSVTEEGSDLIIYVFSIENGLDAANWASWYVTGEGVVWGAYNNVIIAMHNANTYIQ